MFKINVIKFDDIDKELDEEIKKAKIEIADKLCIIGENYVNEAKERGTYQDRTTNLRNANSYRVYIDGVPYRESIGRTETNAMFDKMKIDTGIQLVVGNGINYASLVEGKGYNVTSSGFLKMEKEIRELFRK